MRASALDCADVGQFKAEVIARLYDVAFLKSDMQELCLAVLCKAVLDIGVDCCSGRDGVPGADARYFFDEELHDFFCLAVGINPKVVAAVLRKGGLL